MRQLLGIGAHGDGSHVHVAIAHGDLRKILFLDILARGGELGNRADVRGLGGLTAGVGINLRVEDECVMQ